MPVTSNDTAVILSKQYDSGDDRVQEIGDQLGPDQSGQSPERVHDQGYGNDQDYMPYQCEQERNLPFIHGVHVVHDVVADHHERQGKASPAEE